MKRTTFSATLIIAVMVAILGGRAISAQDKYALTQNDHPIIQTRNSSMGLDHFSIVLIEPGDRGP